MTDELIDTIAEGYAELLLAKTAKDFGVPKSDLYDAKCASKEYLLSFLKWLSARYAIVEKSKVQEMYQANNRLKADFPGSEISNISDHINHCLDCLFPELFKTNNDEQNTATKDRSEA